MRECSAAIGSAAASATLDRAGAGSRARGFVAHRFAIAVLLLASATAAAQPTAYPAKPVRLFLPAAPGGASDIAGRIVAKRLGELLGQPVVAENRAGGGGMLAAEAVARLPPDGYSILFGPVSMTTAPALYGGDGAPGASRRTVPFDPVRDFTPITMGVVLSNVLVVHPSVPATSMRELVALAKARPGTLNYGSSGNASAGHLAGELLASMTGIDIVHVPYKGGGPAMTDLLAGQLQMIFASAPTAIPHVRSGKLRALGVTTTGRLSSLPDVPTIAETVVPDFEANNWYAFFGPAGLPAEIVVRLNRDIGAALASPATREALAVQGLDPAPGTPEALAAYVRTEVEKWGRLIRTRGIRGE